MLLVSVACDCFPERLSSVFSDFNLPWIQACPTNTFTRGREVACYLITSSLVIKIRNFYDNRRPSNHRLTLATYFHQLMFTRLVSCVNFPLLSFHRSFVSEGPGGTFGDRMSVHTDKELSDLLDFSAVSYHQVSLSLVTPFPSFLLSLVTPVTFVFSFGWFCFSLFVWVYASHLLNVLVLMTYWFFREKVLINDTASNKKLLLDKSSFQNVSLFREN